MLYWHAAFAFLANFTPGHVSHSLSYCINRPSTNRFPMTTWHRCHGNTKLPPIYIRLHNLCISDRNPNPSDGLPPPSTPALTRGGGIGRQPRYSTRRTRRAAYRHHISSATCGVTADGRAPAGRPPQSRVDATFSTLMVTVHTRQLNRKGTRAELLSRISGCHPCHHTSYVACTRWQRADGTSSSMW